MKACLKNDVLIEKKKCTVKTLDKFPLEIDDDASPRIEKELRHLLFVENIFFLSILSIQHLKHQVVSVSQSSIFRAFLWRRNLRVWRHDSWNLNPSIKSFWKKKKHLETWLSYKAGSFILNFLFFFSFFFFNFWLSFFLLL